jgi:hypothetical protein
VKLVAEIINNASGLNPGISGNISLGFNSEIEICNPGTHNSYFRRIVLEIAQNVSIIVKITQFFSIAITVCTN